MSSEDRIWEIFDLIVQGTGDQADAYLDQVLQQCVLWFDAGGGSIFLQNEYTGDYMPAAKAGELARVPWDAVIRPGEGLAGKAIQERHALKVGDPDEDPTLSSISKKRAEIASSMVVPLVNRDQVVGVLCLSRSHDEPIFTDDDLKKSDTLGRYIALAVSNAKMLRLNKEIERMKRLAEIGQLTASIAHEIRNPLTGIKSAAQMILQAPEHAPEFAKMIEGETTKLNRLCDEFLNFAKPLTISTKACKLGDLVFKVSAMHEEDYAGKNVQLITRVADSEPWIELDGPRVEQVVRNLVLNALQASRPGSKVVVEVSPEGRLSVEDEGCGMDAETVKQLFTPFFTTKAQGTGLGLSTCRKIADAHGASLKVTSEPGKGSRFEVAFPVYERAA